MPKRIDETLPRRCKKCGEVKPIDEFYFTSKALKDGTPTRKWKCKYCIQEYGKRYQRNNRSHCVKSVRMWREKNRFRWAILASRGIAKKRGYIPCNATEEELAKSFTGFCDVCGISENECSRKLCADHDHDTGDLRGWLCGKCNSALGLMGNSSKLLIKLASYAEQKSEKA